MSIELSASVVLYKTRKELFDRLYSCFGSLHGQIKLWVIDNSPSACIDPQEYPLVTYVHNMTNPGYGTAHNIALREAMNEGMKYHVVLNPDLYFESTVLTELVKFMDAHPDGGMAMPTVRYPQGELQYLCKLLPTPMDLLGRRFLAVLLPKYVERRNARYELRDFGYDKVLDIPSLSGCFMFIRVSALREVGMFDPRYFMYAEDLDLSRRIHEKYATLFVPHLEIVHDHARESYQSLKMLLAHIKSIVQYFNKWGWFWDKQRSTVNRETLSRVRKSKRFEL